MPNSQTMPSQPLTPTAPPCVEKRVSFNSKRNVYVELQTQEFDSFFVYYNKAEYEGIKDDCQAIIQMIKTSTLHVGAEDSVRGLECRTLTGKRRTQKNRRRALRAVMNELCRQEDEGEHDPEMLAVLYKGYSTHSLIQAQRTGTRDAAEARHIALERFETFKDESCDFTVSSVDNDSSTMSLSSNAGSLASDLDESSVNSDKKKMSCKKICSNRLRRITLEIQNRRRLPRRWSNGKIR
jgi:hypothetical protein